MRSLTASHIHYSQTINFQSQLKDSLIVADQYFKNFDFVKRWQQKGFQFYWVKSGEELKTFSSFERHFPKLTQKMETYQLKSVTAWGGGSVGDFVGFFASVYRRGVPLNHVPTTYLSAIDSAHGGKTALNFKTAKNQLGTFYAAQNIFICQALLKTQGQARLYEGWFELFKILLIGAPREALKLCEKDPTEKLFFSLLKKGIDLKYKVVALDPFEQKGARRVLNLGHTFGHAFEASQKIPHGWAVGLGLRWSVEWSFKNELMDWIDFSILFNALSRWLESPMPKHPLRNFQYPSASVVKTLLSKDKKKKGGSQEIYYIGLRGFGGVVSKVVPVDALVDFYKTSLRSLL